MLQSINMLAIIGLVFALPAVWYALRVSLRLLISIIFSKEKVTVTYHSANGDKFEKKVYVKRDDDLLLLLDDIARKNSQKEKSHG